MGYRAAQCCLLLMLSGGLSAQKVPQLAAVGDVAIAVAQSADEGIPHDARSTIERLENELRPVNVAIVELEQEHGRLRSGDGAGCGRRLGEITGVVASLVHAVKKHHRAFVTTVMLGVSGCLHGCDSNPGDVVANGFAVAVGVFVGSGCLALCLPYINAYNEAREREWQWRRMGGSEQVKAYLRSRGH